jgi:anti-sigma factor RsiW
MTDIDIHALAGAYALDAINDLERAAFDRHLAGCEACAFEVAELRSAAARLVDTTWSAAPPRLRDNVLKQVSHTRQTRPGRAEQYVDPEIAPPSPWRRRLVAVAAASLLAAGVGAATYVVQDQRVSNEHAQFEASRAQSEANLRRLTQIQEVMAASDARARQVPVKGGGRISVVYSAKQNAAVAMLAGLNQPASNRAYQLWLVKDNKQASAGVLAPGHNGGTSLVTGIRDAQELAVTQEQAGGAEHPTQAPMAAVSLQTL